MRRHLAHLSTERIEHAIRQAGGNLTVAAEKLGVGRSTLYTRTTEEPSLLATRDEILESFVDEAETAIVAAVRTGRRQRGDVRFEDARSSSRLEHIGVRVRRPSREPEQPRRRVDMTAALRALSPDELMALEGIVCEARSSTRGPRLALVMRATTTAPAGLSDGDISGARSQLPTRSTRSRRLSHPARSSRPLRLIYPRRTNRRARPVEGFQIGNGCHLKTGSPAGPAAAAGERRLTIPKAVAPCCGPQQPPAFPLLLPLRFPLACLITCA